MLGLNVEFVLGLLTVELRFRLNEFTPGLENEFELRLLVVEKEFEPRLVVVDNVFDRFLDVAL